MDAMLRQVHSPHLGPHLVYEQQSDYCIWVIYHPYSSYWRGIFRKFISTEIFPEFKGDGGYIISHNVGHNRSVTRRVFRRLLKDPTFDFNFIAQRKFPDGSDAFDFTFIPSGAFVFFPVPTEVKLVRREHVGSISIY